MTMTTTGPNIDAETEAEAEAEGGLALVNELDGEAAALLSPADEEALAARMEALFTQGLGLPGAEACVVLVDDAHIQSLNREWRQEDVPTDVLSFPLQEGIGAELAGQALGDIVISVPYAARLVATGEVHRARVAAQLGVAVGALAWSLLDEVTFLMIHGALHLLGYDHLTAAQEATMKAEEARLMRPFVGVTS